MLTIYDTTLRDGEQNPDINFSVRDKLEIARALAEFGVDYIELGWPSSNPKELECFFQIPSNLKDKIVAFGSTKKKGIKAEEDKNLNQIIKSNVKHACIFGKTWLEHVEKQLKISPKENLIGIKESIGFLRSQGIIVFYDLEHFFDGYKNNRDYALECIKTAANAGAKTLVLCDTNGGCLPNEIAKIIEEVRLFLEINKINVELGIHAHNDSGCALANTLIAIDKGVEHIQLTVNGFGERTGNCDLCQLIPNLILKKKIELPKIKLNQLKQLSDLVYTLANIKPNSNQPFVGKNAFSHKGGVHIDAIIKGASYEHINPELVGNTRNFVLSDLSGKANIIEMARKFGFRISKDNPRVESLLKEVKELEKRGYDINNLDAEQFLLVNKYFGENKQFFKINTWKIMSEKRLGEYSECVITGTVDNKAREVVAPVKGGPVDAAYKCLRKMISTIYKQIKEVMLINYKVMIAEDKGPESTVRVYIEFKDGDEEWGTVGVSQNILEASLEAIEKGFKYYLMKNT